MRPLSMPVARVSPSGDIDTDQTLPDLLGKVMSESGPSSDLAASPPAWAGATASAPPSAESWTRAATSQAATDPVMMPAPKTLANIDAVRTQNLLRPRVNRRPMARDPDRTADGICVGVRFLIAA